MLILDSFRTIGCMLNIHTQIYFLIDSPSFFLLNNDKLYDAKMTESSVSITFVFFPLDFRKPIGEHCEIFQMWEQYSRKDIRLYT